MCRLFGFRSIIRSQVHRSLVGAENALVWQSTHHPDGWGVAYFVGGYPHVIKSAETALQDTLFRRVSGIVSSHTVVAHLRKATKGQNTLINTHPFQYGGWIFAHNGDISCFDEIRGALHARVLPELRRFILGDTDSEVIFYLLLGHLQAQLGAGQTLHDAGLPIEALAAAVALTVEEIEAVSGLTCGQDDDAGRLLLSFILTNGELLIGHQGGKGLYVSTHKVCCPERDACPSFGASCEAPTAPGQAVNHLIFASEELHGENVWTPMRPREIIGVDGAMRLWASPPSHLSVTLPLSRRPGEG